MPLTGRQYSWKREVHGRYHGNDLYNHAFMVRGHIERSKLKIKKKQIRFLIPFHALFLIACTVENPYFPLRARGPEKISDAIFFFLAEAF